MSAKTRIKVVWSPQPGPQTMLLRCPIFEVLFGGSRGGGKTDGMLGDFVKHAGEYGEDAIGLCVRRERTQLKEMIERSRQIYSPLGAKYSSQDKQWRFPNGARLTFAYLENDADAEAYQGWNTCVAVGTRIKMADGSLKPIELISLGEMVLTLEGPKRVFATVEPYLAECVQAIIRDDAGAVIGQQVHPVWHPVLTPTGVSSLRPAASGQSPAWFSWDDGARGSIDIALHAPAPQSGPSQTWEHPYTGRSRPLKEGVGLGSAELGLFGEALVSDLCVEDANHYISELGVINKNTRIYVEEMGNFPRPEPIFKLMATLRSANPAVKVGFRATANPGGPGHCLAQGEVMTPDGWVDIRCIQVGDPVYTITPQRKIIETTVSQIHREFYSGPLIEISTRGLDMEFTPNHNLAYIPGTKNSSPDMALARIDELPGQTVIARAASSWVGVDPGPVYAPEVIEGKKVRIKEGTPKSLPSIIFARLLGWFLSEGNIIKRRSSTGGIEGFSISQVKPLTKEKLRKFLTYDCGFRVKKATNGFNIYSTSWGYLFRDFNPCSVNYIPRQWLNAPAPIQHALFDSLVDGDGHWVKHGQSGTFYSSSERLVDDFQELAIKLGFITCKRFRERTPEYNIRGRHGCADHTNKEYCVHFKIVKSGGTEILTGNHVYNVETSTKRRSSISEKEFSGHVYCIGVKGTHTFIVRQNGSAWISGNSWIRSRYIDPAPLGLEVLRDKFTNPFTKEVTSMERVYIPSRVTDNRFCNTNDYIARLQMSAGTKLLHAWLHGDWNIVEGAFFSEWDMEKHVIAPFTIPDNWTRFMSADWGSAAPFSIGWWAVVSDDYGDVLGPMSYRTDASAYQGNLPAGAIVRYREWYGSPNHNNVGLKLFAEEVAAGIVERERDEPRNDSGGARIAYRVIDPDACREKGGPSIAERMSWKPNRVFWRAADNARVGRRGAMGGWDAVRARLKGENGVPMLYVFNNCTDLIRCLPVAQHDPDNMEDIDDCEDHCFHGDTLVSTPDGPVKIRELPESGVVNTPVGPKEYHGARLFFHNESTVKLSFSDGSEEICTPDHEFLTTIGWLPASSIINREVISINDGKLDKISCIGLCDSGKTDVYCLTVPDAGCFLLADGKIVANCIDDLRYACMSRPFISSADAAKKDKYLTIGSDNRVTLNDILEQYDHRTPKSYERIR